MSVEIILSRLEGVQDSGRGQWYARCPAHDDKSPSLSIKETEDGTTLIHCFALCSPSDITDAVGLELSDLFPEKLEPRRSQKPRWNPRDLLRVIRYESLVISCAAGQIDLINNDELERVKLAGSRIMTALEVADVR